MHIRYTLATLSAVASLAAVSYVALCLPASARAAGLDEPVSIKVSYADLNLDSRAGAETLVTRVHRAAMSICGPEPTNLLDRQGLYRTCVRETGDRAIGGLRYPGLAALSGPRQTLIAAENRP